MKLLFAGFLLVCLAISIEGTVSVCTGLTKLTGSSFNFGTCQAACLLRKSCTLLNIVLPSINKVLPPANLQGILSSTLSNECWCGTLTGKNFIGGSSCNGHFSQSCLPTGLCSPNPCLNNGTCFTLGLIYMCNCPTGYTGINCATKSVDSCNGLTKMPGSSYNFLTCTAACLLSGRCTFLNIALMPINPLKGILSPTLSNECWCGALSGKNLLGRSCSGHFNQSCLPTGVCSPNPCLNNATCCALNQGFTCICPKGYSGSNCTTKINYCASNPCQNGGQCTDLADSFTCTCPSSYYGQTCALEILTCSTITNPCENGGTCMNEWLNYATEPNAFICSCATGYTGIICDQKINNCSPNPCLNGGVCNNLAYGYSCTCPAGYIGNTCGQAACSASNTCRPDQILYTVNGVSQCQCPIGNPNANPCQ